MPEAIAVVINGFHQLGAAMPILLWLMLLDEVTGVVKGAYLRQLSSEVGIHGLLRKGGVIVLIVAIHVIQPLIPGFTGLDNWFAAAFAFFELLSIAENVRQIGVPLPPQLLGIMKVFSNPAPVAKIVKSTTEITSSDPSVPDTVSKTVTLEKVVKQ
ncbi:MAG: phage holin family protein [Patescibacteria group bacterium]|nr:phage holin family protein [Patescibacteria group bacterium]